MKKENYELYINKTIEFRADLDKTCGKMIYFTVKSNDYIGRGPIYLDEITLKSAIKILSKMVETLDGEFILQDVESLEYYIKINVSDNGVRVEGRIGDYNQNQLQFGFLADQTLLSLLLKVLEQLK